MSRNNERRAEILDDLPAEAKLLFDLEKLKTLARQNPLSFGDRNELVAEHSWHIAMGVILLAPYASEPIDVGRAALLAIVHDVVEAFVGDTFAFGFEVSTQEQRERAAMATLRASTDSASIHQVVNLWDEYEAQDTPEARFVKGVDAFMPIVLNFTNIEHSSWGEHEVHAAQVTKRLDRVRESLADLARYNDAMIAQARIDGDLL